MDACVYLHNIFLNLDIQHMYRWKQSYNFEAPKIIGCDFWKLESWKVNQIQEKFTSEVWHLEPLIFVNDMWSFCGRVFLGRRPIRTEKPLPFINDAFTPATQQHGFRKGNSTKTVLFEIKNQICGGLNQKRPHLGYSMSLNKWDLLLNVDFEPHLCLHN